MEQKLGRRNEQSYIMYGLKVRAFGKDDLLVILFIRLNNKDCVVAVRVKAKVREGLQLG